MGIVPKSFQLLPLAVGFIRVGSEGVEVAQLQLPHFGSFVFAQFFLLLTDPAPGSFEEVRQLAVDLEASLVVQPALGHLLQTLIEAGLVLLPTLASFHLERLLGYIKTT